MVVCANSMVQHPKHVGSYEPEGKATKSLKSIFSVNIKMKNASMSNNLLLCVVALLHQYEIQLCTEGTHPYTAHHAPWQQQQTCLHGNYGEPVKFKCISLKYDIFRNPTKCD